MNAAERECVLSLVHFMGARGWVCVKFWDGEATQRGANPHGMTQDEAANFVASVDDGLLYFRKVDGSAVRYGTVRTIPDHCRDGLELLNDWSTAHGFDAAMDRFVEHWEAAHA